MLRDKDPRILVFDSGFGGLSVLSALTGTMPHADYVYLADDARFPYGELSEDELTSGLVDILQRAHRDFMPDLVVIACNTASTVALETLRDELEIPVVGIVPAIKPAVNATKSGQIAVLATPGTIRRAYTRDLIDRFAQQCTVELVACSNLATLAEEFVLNGERNEAAVREELKSVFASELCQAVDVVVLGCTHYPLLLPVLQQVAPRRVHWIDPAPAIARRVMHLLSQEWQDCLAGERINPVLIRKRISFVASGGGQKRLSDAWDAINRVC